MPINISEIRADWALAKNGGHLKVKPAIVYGDAKDKHGVQIIVEFTYNGDDLHLSFQLGKDQVSAFHITDESDRYIGGGKSGSKRFVKNQPSAYYSFRIRKAAGLPKVDFSKASETYDFNKEKNVAVVSGVINTNLERDVQSFVKGFIKFMMNAGHGEYD